MFLEGFHLHRLIVKAFETPKTILGYYFVGWGTYLRLAKADVVVTEL